MAVKRRYESTHRHEQAGQTRKAILDAAAGLFVDPGYAATPLTAIAAEAGVAIQTVYKVFGSKKALLSALVDVTVAGDDEPVPLPERQFVADIAALTDARAKLARYARHLAETHARQARPPRAPPRRPPPRGGGGRAGPGGRPPRRSRRGCDLAQERRRASPWHDDVRHRTGFHRPAAPGPHHRHRGRCALARHGRAQ